MKRNVALAVTCGLFLGLSFPPSPLHTLAYVGFIPLFLLLEQLESFSQHFRYGYVAMFVFNVVTLYWVGGFTHGRDPYLMLSGGALLLFHPFLSSIPIYLFALVRKQMGLWMRLFAFGFFWTGWEYLHSLGEVSFPWITLGNSQVYDEMRIQIAEIGSVYGLSFLLLLFNILAYVLLIRTASRKWTFRSLPTLLTLGALILVYFLPWGYGAWRIASLEQTEEPNDLRVGIVQPNIDPWEKWGEGYASKQEAYERQLNVLFKMTSEIARDSLHLIVWPETAIPFYALLPQHHAYLWRIKGLVDEIRTPLFSGLPHAEYFPKELAPVTAEKLRSHDELFVESYNAATLFVPGTVQNTVYRKIVLVPFAESGNKWMGKGA
jgi:apolipoprotein N-acyltransferase